MKKHLGNFLRVLLVLLLACSLFFGGLLYLAEQTLCNREFFTDRMVTDGLAEKVTKSVSETVVGASARYQMDADALRTLIDPAEIAQMLREAAGNVYDAAVTGTSAQAVQYPVEKLEAAVHEARGADEFGDASAIANEIGQCIVLNTDFISESAISIPLYTYFFSTPIYAHLREIQYAVWAVSALCALLLLSLPLGGFFRRVYALCGGIFLSVSLPFAALRVISDYRLFDRLSVLGDGRLRYGLEAVYNAFMSRFTGFYNRAFALAAVLLLLSAFALALSAWRAGKKAQAET